MAGSLLCGNPCLLVQHKTNSDAHFWTLHCAMWEFHFGNVCNACLSLNLQPLHRTLPHHALLLPPYLCESPLLVKFYPTELGPGRRLEWFGQYCNGLRQVKLPRESLPFLIMANGMVAFFSILLFLAIGLS